MAHPWFVDTQWVSLQDLPAPYKPEGARSDWLFVHAFSHSHARAIILESFAYFAVMVCVSVSSGVTAVMQCYIVVANAGSDRMQAALAELRAVDPASSEYPTLLRTITSNFGTD